MKGSCHCGAVEFEVNLPEGIKNPARCNCSMCSRKGAIMIAAPLSQFKVIKGEDKLSLYEFNTKTAKHYFCSVCGIYTHHKRRSNPNEYSVNVACLAGVDPFALGEITLIDGRNHIADR